MPLDKVGRHSATECQRGSVASRGVSPAHTLSRKPVWSICCQTKVRLLVDNLTATHYINKMGGTKSPVVARLATDIWEWCLHHNILIVAQYLPGDSVFGQTRNPEYLRPTRLETGPLDFCKTKSDLGPLIGGSVCNSPVISTPVLLQLETRPSFGGSRCLLPELRKSEGICIPSLCSSGLLPQKTARPVIGANM